MSLILPRGALSEAPRAPAEIREAVEMYARESGRTGSIEFAGQKEMVIDGARYLIGPNTWMVKLSLKPNDPAMRAWQEGLAPEPPVETVWLQEPNPDEGKREPGGTRAGPYRALDIYQMGASGVREFLERGNMWSGRGVHRNMVEATKFAYEQGRQGVDNHRASMKEDNRHEQRETRRRRLKIPFLPVGISLKRNTDT